MYLLLNRDEIVSHLTRMLLTRQLRNRTPAIGISKHAAAKFRKRMLKKTKLVSPRTFHDTVSTQLRKWKNSIEEKYKTRYKETAKWVDSKLDTLPQKFLINIVRQNQMPSFVKTLGPQLCSTPRFVTRSQVRNNMDPVLIRNIVNNEELIKNKLTNNKDFWFIDTGYTNFLEGKKHWHRLVRGHIHHSGAPQTCPHDRLHLLPYLPAAWRQDGDAILVIESSLQHYQMFGLTLESWREQIVTELKKHTDRPIEFRSKLDKKQRDNLYEKLLASDYYCVIHHSSAAAIESIWAGIPVITLGQHITKTVSKNQLSDVNNLYRGDINSWLRQLTYSQYSKEELFDGTALRLLKGVGYV